MLKNFQLYMNTKLTKGRADGGDDLEKGGRCESSCLKVEAVVKRRGMLNN